MTTTNPTKAATPQTAPAASAHAPREGVKDTVESIIVAFIMAFVFRAFVVEAFVIPTGSMAPTLLGKHGTLTCSDCGYEFDYGLTDQSQSRQGTVDAGDEAICPNCRHANSPLSVNDTKNNAESGDRILVLKWPYELGSERLGPQRWDVTVFKDPADGTTNFIKRLVGVPNEVLMIVDGDVYTAPLAVLSEPTRKTLAHYRAVKHRLLWDERSGLGPGDRDLFKQPVDAAVLAELEGKLAIRRKSDEAQAELWSIVYDHDYPPQDRDDGQPYWAPLARSGSAWNAESRRVSFDGVGKPADGLTLLGDLSRSAPIVDFYSYNVDAQRPAFDRTPIHYPVSDLRLAFVLVPRSGGGALTLKLTKGSVAFWARIGSDGHVSLTRTASGEDPRGAAPLLTSRVDPMAPGRNRAVAFENVDYRVRLSIDGRVVLETAPDQYAPDLRSLRADWRAVREAAYRSQPELREAVRARPRAEAPRIYAEDTSLELWHLAVHRDVYYTPVIRPHEVSEWCAVGWGVDGNPIALGEGEFFMLGDNSPQSKDSRLWDHAGEHMKARGEDFQLGSVPRDQLIGRAFFVYWPSGLRPEWLPFVKEFGIIPNVGRMRWIR